MVIETSGKSRLGKIVKVNVAVPLTESTIDEGKNLPEKTSGT